MEIAIIIIYCVSLILIGVGMYTNDRNLTFVMSERTFIILCIIIAVIPVVNTYFSIALIRDWIRQNSYKNRIDHE
jgi:hypothetical protein